MRGFQLTASAIVLALASTLLGTAEARGPELDPVAVLAVRPAVSSTAQESPGQHTFRQYCVPCHGERGHGDGPAAVAFNPRPADFTDPDGLAKLTDEQVMEVISRGRGSMPAWGAILKQEQLVPLVAYLRELSRGEG